MRASWALCLGLLLASLLPLRGYAQESAALRRYALIVAANDGGRARVRLKHAPADARAMHGVLTELAGVLPGDVRELVEPSVAQLERDISEMRERIRATRVNRMRAELLFYYSGHSDEQGILLGEQRLPYRALRALLDEVEVEVRVAVLDSCASGAFTREKGGVRRAPFLFDTSTAVRGHAFLTSASEHEAAQESDALGGSFFTHFLVSGLRGAADASGDGKVTLTEAYRFAFEETLARTGQTQLGAQHPAYDIRLAGTGDLVLTDLRSTSSELQLAPDVEGRLMVRDTRGGLVLELSKRPGRLTRIALPASAYIVELRRGDRLYEARINTDGTRARVGMAEFSSMDTERGRGRGDGLQYVPASAALVPQLSTNALVTRGPVENGFNFALLMDAPHAVRGLQLSLAISSVRERAIGLQIASLASYARDVTGAQLTMLSSYAGRVRGLQAGVLNLAREALEGLQLGGINYAQSLSGVSVGGITVVDRARGVQLGAVNVARGSVRGLQLGLFNYAGEADVAIGALTYTRAGGAHLMVSTGDTAFMTWALRLDAKYNYNFLAVSFHPVGRSERRGYAVGLGFGGKVPLLGQLLWLDIDLGAHVVQAAGGWQRGLPNTLTQLRFMLRVELHKYLSVFAGPTFNLSIQTSPEQRARVGFGIRSHRIACDEEGLCVSYWPGVIGGLRF